MSIPKIPGMSFVGMATLIENWRVSRCKTEFPTELLLAISWEESLFNNVKQSEAGTAVGFGQMEPKEFWKLESAQAKQRGYNVEGLPRRDGANLKGTATLTQFQAVKVQSAMLCQLYMDLNNNSNAALEAYAGVPWSRQVEREVAAGTMTKQKADKLDPLKVSGRLAIIAGWQKCADVIANQLPDTDPRAKIKEALNYSREFKNLEGQFHPILFPEGDEFWQSNFKYCIGKWTI